MATTKTTIKALAKLKAEKPYELTTADKASIALRPSLNGAAVIQASRQHHGLGSRHGCFD